jgi:hypothetical protein
MMMLTVGTFKKKGKNLTTVFRKSKGTEIELFVTEYIENLIEPLLKEIEVKEYYKNDVEDVKVEVLDTTKLPELMRSIDKSLSDLFSLYKNSKELVKKNEIIDELESISNLNSFIRKYLSFLCEKPRYKKNIFIYYE